jgi:hypothetical protein
LLMTHHDHDHAADQRQQLQRQVGHGGCWSSAAQSSMRFPGLRYQHLRRQYRTTPSSMVENMQFDTTSRVQGPQQQHRPAISAATAASSGHVLFWGGGEILHVDTFATHQYAVSAPLSCPFTLLVPVMPVVCTMQVSSVALKPLHAASTQCS